MALIPRPTFAPASATRPPGFAGEVFDWLLRASLLPVPEVALVTTLGIAAGIMGRAYTTPAPHTGLNIYLILVGRSATGKEMLHDGAGALLVALRQRVPSVVNLINFDDYVSGPALAKQCAESRCFVNFNSEFGRRLKRMANPKDAPMADLRTTYTKLYSKSGPSSFVGDLVYSNARHSIPGAVAFSVIGETTPGTLRTAMTPDMMEDGFLSRFGWLEYTGDRPTENDAAALHTTPPEALVAKLAEVAVQAMTMLANNTFCPIRLTHDAQVRLDVFKGLCTVNINAAGEDESLRQIWNRAHLKALKYAGLVAGLDNHTQPVATLPQVEWAIGLVQRDAALFEQSLANGDVGSDATAQEKKLLHMIGEFLHKPLSKSYAFVPAAMQTDGVVPRKYLQKRTSDTACFLAHPLGATVALDKALQSLCDSGYLAEIDKVKAGEVYTFQGRCFKVVELPKA